MAGRWHLTGPPWLCQFTEAIVLWQICTCDWTSTLTFASLGNIQANMHTHRLQCLIFFLLCDAHLSVSSPIALSFRPPPADNVPRVLIHLPSFSLSLSISHQVFLSLAFMHFLGLPQVKAHTKESSSFTYPTPSVPNFPKCRANRGLASQKSPPL